MNKKTVFFILLLAAVLVGWLVESRTPENPPALIKQMVAYVDGQPLIKSSVWNRSNLSVGIIPGSVDPGVYAAELCQQFLAMGAVGVTVSIVDVLLLQQTGGDEWREIAYRECR